MQLESLVLTPGLQDHYPYNFNEGRDCTGWSLRQTGGTVEKSILKVFTSPPRLDSLGLAPWFQHPCLDRLSRFVATSIPRSGSSAFTPAQERRAYRRGTTQRLASLRTSVQIGAAPPTVPAVVNISFLSAMHQAQFDLAARCQWCLSRLPVPRRRKCSADTHATAFADMPGRFYSTRILFPESLHPIPRMVLFCSCSSKKGPQHSKTGLESLCGCLKPPSSLKCWKQDCPPFAASLNMSASVSTEARSWDGIIHMGSEFSESSSFAQP